MRQTAEGKKPKPTFCFNFVSHYVCVQAEVVAGKKAVDQLKQNA